MYLASILPVSLLIAGVCATSPSKEASLVWCTANGFESCPGETPVASDGSCREIPDSNKRGDAGSLVTIINADPKDESKGNFCMTMYYSHGCKERAKVDGRWLEFDYRYYMIGPGIFRSYRVLDVRDKKGAKCDGHAFDKFN